MKNNCVLCEKYDSRIFESQYFFAVYDDFPVREGHLLIIPRRHVEQLEHLKRDEFSDLYRVVQMAVQHSKYVSGGRWV